VSKVQTTLVNGQQHVVDTLDYVQLHAGEFKVLDSQLGEVLNGNSHEQVVSATGTLHSQHQAEVAVDVVVFWIQNLPVLLHKVDEVVEGRVVEGSYILDHEHNRLLYAVVSQNAHDTLESFLLKSVSLLVSVCKVIAIRVIPVLAKANHIGGALSTPASVHLVFLIFLFQGHLYVEGVDDGLRGFGLVWNLLHLLLTHHYTFW